MKRTGNPNINTPFYWSFIYQNKKKQAEYERIAATGEHGMQVDGGWARPSKRFQTAVDLVKDGDKVLDIGCGVGTFTGMVQDQHKCEIWGVDISKVVIEADKKKHPDIRYIQQYVGRLDKVPTDYFDVVFGGEVLEHLDDPKSLLEDGHGALKVGGLMIVTTPNGNAVDSPEHVWYFDKEDVEKLFKDAGFKDIEFIKLPDLEHTIVFFVKGIK